MNIFAEFVRLEKMMQKTFFFHNPKAGGCSLRQIFESRVSAERLCPLIENDKVEHESSGGEYARFRGYDLYAGHYGRDIFVVVNEGHGCVTNFRHPVTRLLSLYNYFRFNVNLSYEQLLTDRFYAVLLAKSESFEQFVSCNDPRVEVYIRNSHFRQLANSCWSLETTKPFEDVCRFVDSMPWYYVCEYPEKSLAWMRRVFNFDLDGIPRVNVTRDQGGRAKTVSTLDDRTYQIILGKNVLDFALYQHAVDRLLTRAGPHSQLCGSRTILESGIQGLPQISGVRTPKSAATAPARLFELYRNARLITSPALRRRQVTLHSDSSVCVDRYPSSGIISYAQNGEDILLWRALCDIKEGFYVDVGAQDPTCDSVTRAFYNQGWRGINVEPVREHFDKLCLERPRDLTLQVAVGEPVGWGTLYEFPNTGLSTLDEKVASGHRARGLSDIHRHVPIVTLASVWRNFVKGEVHFLKIDVEGYEGQVLSGMDLTNLRPWIILIEATRPGTSVAACVEGERILLTSRYEFVHFDGLNRWYIAQERSNLKARFEAPPNIFDRFELATTISLRDDLAAAKHDLEQMRASASWRWTAPFRAAKNRFCRLTETLRSRFRR
jgi:FkbM family methyltransferase